jgi:segregation and condensation protein B
MGVTLSPRSGNGNHRAGRFVQFFTKDRSMSTLRPRCDFGPLARRSPAALPCDRRLPDVHRRLEDAGRERGPTDPLARPPQLAMLEAALLIADEPLPLRKLAHVAGLPDSSTARGLLKQLQSRYDADGTAFQVHELAGGFQLLTRSAYHRWLAPLRRKADDIRLTGAAKETLAIVAYRQPIMRAEIEAIRGVHCGETLRLLMEKGLVKITGRDDSLGRPVLYGTTKKFLQHFGLKSLRDLPRSEHLKPATKAMDPSETGDA